MICIDTTLDNFNTFDPIFSFFQDSPTHYTLSHNGTLRYSENPTCERCGTKMRQNGYNIVTKRDIASIKVGKYRCPKCNNDHYTDISFWEEKIKEIVELIGNFIMCLKNGGCSYRRIAQAMKFVLPFGKSVLLQRFYNFILSAEYLPPDILNNTIILCFDEQYLKIRGKWRYRLTLLDWKTKSPIAEKVVLKVTNQTIIDFFKSNFNPNLYEKIYIVSDLKPSYRDVFKLFFGEKLIHQYCLFHLFQAIIKEFPKSSSFFEMSLQYNLFNIFYDYEFEIDLLSQIVLQEQDIRKQNEKTYKLWLKAKKEETIAFFKQHRKNNSNKIREPLEAYSKMMDVSGNLNKMPVSIQKRFKMIEASIENFLAFRLIPGAPATNNALEGYFSSTTDPILKYQMKTVRGAEISIKSYALEKTSNHANNEKCQQNKKKVTFIDLISPLRLFGKPK